MQIKLNYDHVSQL